MKKERECGIGTPLPDPGAVSFVDGSFASVVLFYVEQQVLVQKRTFGRWVNYFLQKVRDSDFKETYFSLLCTSQIEASTSPRATPGHLNF